MVLIPPPSSSSPSLRSPQQSSITVPWQTASTPVLLCQSSMFTCSFLTLAPEGWCPPVEPATWPVGGLRLLPDAPHDGNVLAKAAKCLQAQFLSETGGPSTVTDAVSLPEKSQLSNKLRTTPSKWAELPCEKEQKRAWQVAGPRTCNWAPSKLQLSSWTWPHDV